MQRVRLHCIKYGNRVLQKADKPRLDPSSAASGLPLGPRETAMLNSRVLSQRQDLVHRRTRRRCDVRSKSSDARSARLTRELQNYQPKDTTWRNWTPIFLCCMNTMRSRTPVRCFWEGWPCSEASPQRNCILNLAWTLMTRIHTQH